MIIDSMTSKTAKAVAVVPGFIGIALVFLYPQVILLSFALLLFSGFVSIHVSVFFFFKKRKAEGWILLIVGLFDIMLLIIGYLMLVAIGDVMEEIGKGVCLFVRCST